MDNIFSKLRKYEESGLARLKAFKERQRQKSIERESRKQQQLVQRLSELRKEREEVGKRALVTGEQMRLKEDISKEKKFIEGQKPHYFRKGLKYAGKGAVWGGKLAYEGARAVIKTPERGQYTNIPKERYIPERKEPKIGLFDWDKPRKGYRQKQFAKKKGFFDWDKPRNRKYKIKKGLIKKRGFFDW